MAVPQMRLRRDEFALRRQHGSGPMTCANMVAIMISGSGRRCHGPGALDNAQLLALHDAHELVRTRGFADMIAVTVKNFPIALK